MARHRLRFTKTGRAVYLSHLDLMRTIQRVFQRAGVRIWHSEGFNPQAYISAALPLSLGVESMCELLDFEVVDDTPIEALPELLNAKLPEGIVVLEAYETARKVKELAWLRITGTLEYDALADTEEMARTLEAFFKAGALLVTKQTKKKEAAEVDIAPLIREIAFTPDGAHRVRMEAVIAAQNPGLNPNLLLEALGQRETGLMPDFVWFARVEVYDGEMQIFC